MYAAGFGLVHGFGFAGALGEVGLPREVLGWALAGFNAGVEIGRSILDRGGAAGDGDRWGSWRREIIGR